MAGPSDQVVKSSMQRGVSGAVGWGLILLGIVAYRMDARYLWVMLSLLVMLAVERGARAYEQELGAPAPGKCTLLSGMWALCAVIAGSIATGFEQGIDAGGRIGLAVLVVGIAGFRVARLWRHPGADRFELAWGVVRDRYGRALVVVVAIGMVGLAAAGLLGLFGGALPLVVGLVALLAFAGPGARRRAMAVRRLRVLAANLGRVADPGSVRVDVVHWLAVSDDIIDSAVVFYPPTSWIAPEEPTPLEDAFARAGWRCRVFAEERTLGVERMEAPVPLPDRDVLDVDERPVGLALRLGVTHDGEGQVVPAVWDPDAADPHLLAVGPTKSGKSVLLRCLLAQAVAGRWTIMIADPKGVDYRWAFGLPGVAVRASGDNAFEGVDAAVEEMHERQAWMEEHAPLTATNLSEVPDNPFPNVLVVVDELAELVTLGDKRRRESTSAALGSLARRARFVNMVIVVATQRPDASIIGGEVRGNLGTRVLAGEGEQQHKLMAFGTTEMPRLSGGYPRGRGRLMVGGAGPREFQAAFIDPQTVIDAHLARDDQAADRPPAEWQTRVGDGR